MANELSFENIERPAGWDLFNDPNEGAGGGGQQQTEQPQENNGGQQTPQNQEQQPAENVRIPDDQLFPVEENGGEGGGEGEPSESVGGKNNKQGAGTPPDAGNSGESSANFYSSTADAMRKDGVLEFLDDNDIASIKDADSWRSAWEKEIHSRLDERYRMLDEAMGYGADVQALAQYQSDLAFLNSVDPSKLENDSDETMVQLRKDLIVNHFKSMGFDEKQAEYEYKKSIDTNNDVRDAKYALEMQKKFFQGEVDKIISTARTQEEQKQKELADRQQRVTDNIMNNKDIFGTVTIDKRVREKIVNVIYEPKFKDNNGNYYSELQNFQQQHPDECLQLLGLVYVLTDGGKDMAKMTNAIARREKNENIKNLEKMLRGQNGSGGGLRFVENGRAEQTGKAAEFTPVF